MARVKFIPLTWRERFAFALFATARRIMPAGAMQDARVYPYRMSRKATWSITGLLTAYQASKDVRPRVDWHAVAVQMAQRWLHNHEPEELYEVAFAEGNLHTEALLARLDEGKLTGLRKPYIVVLWEGRNGAAGVQVIGQRKLDEF